MSHLHSLRPRYALDLCCHQVQDSAFRPYLREKLGVLAHRQRWRISASCNRVAVLIQRLHKIKKKMNASEPHSGRRQKFPNRFGGLFKIIYFKHTI